MTWNAPQPLDFDVLDCIRDVIDPEIGLSVVDLGLVYRAERRDDAIDVALTLTTRACPLGEMIVEDVRERLVRRFQDVPHITVELVWSPLWTPDRISPQGQELLSRTPRKAAS